MKIHNKSKKLIPKVLSLYNTTNLSTSKISIMLGLSRITVKKIALNYNISDERVNRKNRGVKESRNNEVFKLLEDGLTYLDISIKMGVSKQRIQQLAKRYGISRWSDTKKNNLMIKENIDLDLKSGVSYNDLKIKYGYKIIGVSSKLRKIRNLNITDNYKNKTANEVLEINSFDLINPNKVLTRNSVYSISAKNGFKKYPNIGNRNEGGSFETYEVIKIIIDGRKNKQSFEEISNFLNDKGLKTITGKSFTPSNVWSKFRTIKR